MDFPISHCVVNVRICNLQDAPERPDVHLEAVALLAEHLRGDVVGGSAQGLLPLAVKFNLGREAKVPFEKKNI